MYDSQQVMQRINGLSPAHQKDVHAIVTGRPTLKHKFEGGGGSSNSMNMQTQNERSTLLSSFEKYAGWTIPALFPPEQITGGEEVQYDYQSFGAQAVNNLANKMTVTLFHPSRPFFKAQAPQSYIEDSGRPLTDIETEMSAVEAQCMTDFAERDGRTAATDILMQLIVTGNGLLQTLKGRPYRCFSYRDYDASFDPWGRLAHMVLREWVCVNTLPAHVAKACMDNGKRESDLVQIFTGVKRLKLDHYVVWQEVENYGILSGDYGVYSEDSLPYKPQRWLVVPGRQAGVGLVEQMAGDFHTLSCMAEADLDLLAIMLDIKTLVKPGGKVKLKEINDSDRGSYVSGEEGDLTSHSHDVSNQVQFLDGRMDKLIRRLSQMFLLNSNAIRDAERVTAEEIRYIAQELDQVHGGVYSRTARTLQRPLALDLLRNVDVAFKTFKPLIVTGLESLSRLSELDSYRGFIQDITNFGQALQGPHARWVNVEGLTKKFAAGWGVDISTVLLTPEQVQAEEKRQLKLQAQAAAAEQLPGATQ
ncbi:head-tail adaptor [Vibrio phage K436]